MLLGATAVTLVGAPARAAEPVTAPDAVSFYAGNGREVDLLANDADLDATDELAVCRLGPESYRRVFAETIGDGLVFAYSLPGAAPGTYTFTYYACDYESLVPGTLTVTVQEAPDIRAKALKSSPGRIKVTKPADFKVTFLHGSFKNPEPDGIVRIARGSSIVIDVRRTRIDWLATTRTNEFLRQGRVKGITLPPGTQPPAMGRTRDRAASVWGLGG